jgi:hypothetical protein
VSSPEQKAPGQFIVCHGPKWIGSIRQPHPERIRERAALITYPKSISRGRPRRAWAQSTCGTKAVNQRRELTELPRGFDTPIRIGDPTLFNKHSRTFRVES